MPNVGQNGGWIVAVLAAATVMAQIGATRVVAETPAHKATASCPGGSTGITLPKGFCATIFADKIGHARQLAVAPDGTVFVDTWSGRYYGNDKPHEGGFLVALKDTKDAGQADVNVRFGQTFAEGSHGGTGIALYKHWLYAEVNDRIERYLRIQLTLSGGTGVDDREHRQILAACRERNVALASELLVSHIRKACESLLSNLPKIRDRK